MFTAEHFRIQSSFPYILRKNVVAFVLIVFLATTLLGFTLYIELKPAPAQAFGIDGAVIIGWATVRDILIGAVIAAATQIAVKFALDLIQKLESHHTIGNILYYADALEYDQYIGDQLNKLLINRSQEQVINAPANTNISDILEGFSSQPIVNYSPAQVQQIAMQKDRGGGLTDEQEAMLVRGAAALLTSQVQCGGINQRAVRNVAIYNATRAARYNPNQIDPRGGSEFYRQLGAQGNPYANVDFQEQVLRDFAASAEAEARRAGALELLSDGSKSLRGLNSTTIARASSSIVGFIEAQATAASAAALGASSGGNAVATAVTQTISGLIQAVIYKVGSGRLINERGFCGTGRVADSTYDDPVDILDPENGFITANGQTVTAIQSGQSATLNWSTGDKTGPAEISGVGPVNNVGTLQVTPNQTTVYQLSVAPSPNCRPYENEENCVRSPGQQLTNLIIRLSDLEDWINNGSARDDAYYTEYADLIDVLQIVIASVRNLLQTIPPGRADTSQIISLMNTVESDTDSLLSLVSRDPRPENLIQQREQALLPKMNLLSSAATSFARSFRGEFGEDADRITIGAATVVVESQDPGGGGGGGGTPGQCTSPYLSEIRSARIYQSNILNAFDEVYDANPQLADDTSNSEAVAIEIVGLVVANLASKGFEVGTTINCNGVHHPEQAIVIGQRPNDDFGENYDTLRGTAGPPTGETFRQKTQANYIDHASWNRCVGNSCN